MRWLRHAMVVLLFSGFGVLYSAAPACACSCIGGTPGEAFDGADVVFVGRAVDVDEPWRGPLVGSADPVTITFAVSGVYKGDVPVNARVRTARYGDACGYEFAEGSNYLVFAYASDDGWTTGLCAGNQALAQAVAPPPDSLPGEVVRTGAYPPGPAIDYPMRWSLLLVLLGGVAAIGVLGVAVLLVRGRRRRTTSKIGSSGDVTPSGSS